MTAVAIPSSPFRGKVTQARVIVSEWTKLRSVRSTRWSLLVATVLTIGFPILAAAVISSHWGHQSAAERASFNPLDPALIGSQIAQLAIGILGVLVISAEYSTGMIRATFTAVPKRLPVLWAKAVVFALVTFVLMLPSVLIAFFASQSILSRDHLDHARRTQPGALDRLRALLRLCGDHTGRRRDPARPPRHVVTATPPRRGLGLATLGQFAVRLGPRRRGRVLKTMSHQGALTPKPRSWSSKWWRICNSRNWRPIRPLGRVWWRAK